MRRTEWDVSLYSSLEIVFCVVEFQRAENSAKLQMFKICQKKEGEKEKNEQEHFVQMLTRPLDCS